MGEEILVGLMVVLALGVGAQWISWRLKLPAILILLLAGFAAGPACAYFLGHAAVDPDELMGEGLFPFISAAVAIILFEGGLSLRLSELKRIGFVVNNLIFIGGGVTWVLATTAAYLLMGFDPWLALLLGAILVVTGPTVIGPLLQQVRLRGKLGSVLRWEGILNDPAGAILAVLVFEALLTHQGMGVQEVTLETMLSVFESLGVGLLVGAVGAAGLVLPLWRYWIPDFLQSPVTLVVVIAGFVVSNHYQPESGLLAVTVMGILLANQQWATVKHIIEFKENLRVLLIATLFILLAARLEVQSIMLLGWGHIAFVAAVIFIVRPTAVMLATIRSDLNWRQRFFLCTIAPRGVVAASVSSIFAIRLGSEYAHANELVPVTFLVILGTITLGGLIARPLARWLDLATTDPQGILIAGAHKWARQIATTLQGLGFDVLLVDSNPDNVLAARMQNLPARHGSILSDEVLDSLDLTSTRRLLALTPNDEANALAAVHLIEMLGRKEVYQLTPKQRPTAEDQREHAQHLRGRYLFSDKITFEELDKRFARGATLKATRLTDEFDYDDFRERYGSAALPMFLVEEDRLRIMTASDTPKPQAGQLIVSLIDEPA